MLSELMMGKFFRLCSFLLFFLLFVSPPPSHSTNLYKYHQVSMGTVIEIILLSEDEEAARKASLLAFQEVKRIEQLMSPWIETSEVSRLNRSAGMEGTKVSPETLEVIKMATIIVSDSAIATSGDYEKFFFHQGKRYHHILNPKTGFPAEGCQSVTILSKDGVTADGLATAVFVLGAEKGFVLCQNLEGVECLIVDGEGKTVRTPGLKDRISFHP